jgi:proteasome lid subunit RPN8/RPN11
VLEKRLLASRPGKYDNAIADMQYINSQAFADKFKGKYENEQVENAVVKACRQLVKNRNGTFFEEAYFIDSHTGRTISYVKGKQKNSIEMSKKLKQRLTNAREKSIIMIHNHPNSSPLSRADYLTSSAYKSCYEAIAVGHNGDVYSFKNMFGTQGELLGTFVENGKEYPYYEAIRDYRVAYSKYTLRGQDDFQARNSAWEDVSKIRGFAYEKK